MDFGLQRKQVGFGSWIREETMETGADPMCFQGEEFSILKKNHLAQYFFDREETLRIIRKRFYADMKIWLKLGQIR